MFVCSPTVASPMYDRCGTFEPSPICAFFVSTNVPILPFAPSSVPGRRYANGPTLARGPITASEPCVRTTVAPGPTSTSVSVVSGPTVAPSRTTVAPCSWVPGSSVTSRSSSTSTSTQVVAGSTTVTPSRIQSSRTRRLSSAPSVASCTRSLTPSTSTGSSVRSARTWPPSARAMASTSVRYTSPCALSRFSRPSALRSTAASNT